MLQRHTRVFHLANTRSGGEPVTRFDRLLRDHRSIAQGLNAAGHLAQGLADLTEFH
jgi:hypothetical protein